MSGEPPSLLLRQTRLEWLMCRRLMQQLRGRVTQLPEQELQALQDQVLALPRPETVSEAERVELLALLQRWRTVLNELLEASAPVDESPAPGAEPTDDPAAAPLPLPAMPLPLAVVDAEADDAYLRHHLPPTGADDGP